MLRKIGSGLAFQGRPRAIDLNRFASPVLHLDMAEVDVSFIGHLQKQQICELLNVVAVIDSVMSKGVAKAPKFLNNISHAAIASLNSLIHWGRRPPKE